ncbi:MAG TPA: glycosyltransferase family 2 protein [Kofleriaceae bacterium]|nr:glycosyltransferase family 2 protein [Kofleriaceae bacterium]
MYRDARIAVIVPAFNEERAIANAIATIPAIVDHIVVIDDASADDTGARASAVGDARVEVVRHAENRGVGAALVTGYRRALELGAEIVAVMAGDGQMDPADLPALLDPICDGVADYVKGNRFLHPDVWSAMPRARIVGNVVLSAATRLTSGYKHVFDSQCGYTAASRAALEAIDLGGLFPRYGYPNDLLSRLHAAALRVVDVRVRPVYGPHWHSGINFSTAFHPIPWVLLRSWGTRIATETRARWRRAAAE